MSVFNASRLLGKTVIITGASSGIGAATALLFAKAGCNLVLLARRAEALQKVTDACSSAHKEGGAKEGGTFVNIPFDIADKAQVSSFWDKVPSALRNVDVLVNNAGFVRGVDHVGSIADEDIEEMFATNVLGLIRLTQVMVKVFKAQQSGHIINLGSIAGLEAYAGGSIYCATKHAVNAFTGSLRSELVNTPIRVTEVQPGMVETEFSLIRFKGNKDAASKVYTGLQPLTAEDVAEEIVWSASRPPHVNIAETLIFPVNQATATINFRKT